MSKIIIGLFVLLTSSALIVLKLGLKAGAPLEFAGGKLHLNLNAYSISGILLYGMSFLVYIYLLSRHDLGYIIPLTTGLVYAVIFTASYFVFHEVFTITKIFGIALIVAGLLFLNIRH